MSDTVRDWVALVDALHPESDAEGWDATGLQVGDPDDPVRAVLVCLDVTPAVLDEASERGTDLVLAHHPLLFRPLPRLTPASAAGRVALAAARRGLSVLAAHTNLDAAVDGTSTPVVDLLGLVDVVPLSPTPARADRAKLVTFVPAEATSAVLAALSAAGAGVIGEYDECSFRVAGTGTFRPSAQASPAVGESGRRNEVPEDRLEVVVPTSRVAAAVAALRAAHPYEEVAVDVHPLLALPPVGPAKGIGRVGDLPQPLPLRGVAGRIRTRLPAPHLRLAGDPDAPVRRVAVCGGAGDSLVDAARRARADVYVTGDLRHHVVLDALTQGLAMIDAGHHATEVAALPSFVERLRAVAASRDLAAPLLASVVATDPWAPAWAAPEAVHPADIHGGSPA